MATASAIRSPASPRIRPSVNVPNSAWPAASEARGEHGRQEDLPEALVAPRPIEGRYGVSEGVDGATILTLGLVGQAKAPTRHACRTTSPLAVASARERWAVATAWSYAPLSRKWVEEKARGLSQATRVVESHCERLGLAQIRQDTVRVMRRQECGAQASRNDSLLARVSRVSGSGQGTEGLLERHTASRWADRARALSPAWRR